MKIGLLALSGVRAVDAELFALGLNLPGFVERSRVIASLPSLGLLTLAGLTPDRIPSASGLSNFVRITAGAMGTSLVTTLWDSRATMHHAHMVERISTTDPGALEALSSLQAAGLTAQQAATQVNRLIDQQAFTRAADDVFLASAVLFLLLIPLIWLAKVKRGATSVDGGAH